MIHRMIFMIWMGLFFCKPTFDEEEQSMQMKENIEMNESVDSFLFMNPIYHQASHPYSYPYLYHSVRKRTRTSSSENICT